MLSLRKTTLTFIGNVVEDSGNEIHPWRVEPLTLICSLVFDLGLFVLLLLLLVYAKPNWRICSVN